MNHLPAFIPLAFILGALLIPLFAPARPRVAQLLALVSTGLALTASGLGLARVLREGAIRYHLAGWTPPIGIELVLDPLSAFLCVIITAVAFAVLLHSGEPVSRELSGKQPAFYSCALLFLGGLAGIVVTGDLFNLYVFLEISSLAGYALVALGDKRAPVSAFRYLILGTVGASFCLLGLGFLLLTTGSLNMADVARILPRLGESPALVVALVLIAMGLALKMALFPMHGWLPDAYTHASSTATALIAPLGTKVAAYALIRIFFFVFEADSVRGDFPLTTVIGYLGAVGIVTGSVMAIAQTDLKRMLAYSSVGQVGYIALGVGLASPLGLIGAVLHTLNHACMKAALFLVSANFKSRLGHTDISRLDHSLQQRMPWTAAAFTLAALSMIGLPPTAGFFSKWYLALGAIEQGRWSFIVVIVLSSLLNAVYFFRVIEKLYLPSRETPADADGKTGETVAVPRADSAPLQLWPTVILAAVVLGLGLANALIVNHVIKLMIPTGL
jgi:multicomponent Na+:H+ antiporter subunit D